MLDCDPSHVTVTQMPIARRSNATLPFAVGKGPTQADLVEATASLISPPSVCMKVMALVRSPNSSADDFARLISTDPNLAVRVLRIVNSAYYGFRAEIESLNRAVVILGTRDLANIVLAISAVRSFSKLGGGLVDIDTFWRHGIWVALAARRLARDFSLDQPERLFVAGLLHDVGSAVLYCAHPPLASWVRENVGWDETDIHTMEFEHLDFTHASLAAVLLESWELPESLRTSINSHHENSTSTTEMSEGLVLQIADRLASATDQGVLGEQAADPDAVSEQVAGLAGDLLPQVQVAALVDEVNVEFSETARALRS